MTLLGSSESDARHRCRRHRCRRPVSGHGTALLERGIREMHLAWPQPAFLSAANTAMLSRGEHTMRSAGKRTVTVAPTPTSSVTVISPWWTRTVA